jgi:quercetin dioxygenase-like cupin family protein
MRTQSNSRIRSTRGAGAAGSMVPAPERSDPLRSRRTGPVSAGRVLAFGATTLAILAAGAAAGCSGTDNSQHPTQTGAVATAEAFASALGASHDASEPEWGPAPEIFPPGAELAVLQGNPSEIGAVFTLRLRMPNGYVFPPHFHPEDEHVTVMQGKFLVGLGNVVNEASAIASLQRGGFITAPKMHNHWAIARGVTVVQVHGIGPFQTTFVDEHGDALPQ